MDVFSCVLLILAATAGAIWQAGAAPNRPDKPETQATVGGIVTELGSGDAEDPPSFGNKTMKTLNRSVERNRRNVGNDFQATLTSDERGGLDSILIQNLAMTLPVIGELMELDIDMNTDSQQRQRRKRNSVTSSSRLWPGGVVPYQISFNINYDIRMVILEAIEEYEQQTCLTFIDKQPGHEDYILFVQNYRCSSSVGRTGGRQTIYLAFFCGQYRGVIIHEIAHAIGVFHQHTRPDRDDYVQIIFENVTPTMLNQFTKHSSDATTQGIEYDYDSIMHYSQWAYSRNRQRTIVPVRDDVYELGQKVRLSPGDITEINRLYSCEIRVLHQLTEENLRPADHIDFADQKFKIRDHTGHRCLATPPAIELEPLVTNNDRHHGHLYPIVSVDCDTTTTSQLWHKSKHFIVNLDTRLCMGVVFEPGDYEGRVVLQTCKESRFMDQVWYCSGHFIKDFENSSCLSSQFPDGEKRKKREIPLAGLSSAEGRLGDYNLSRPRRNAMDKVALKPCNSGSQHLYWTFSDPEVAQGVNQENFHRGVCTGNTYAPQRCYPANMRPATLVGEKQIRCDSLGYYVTGFSHTYLYETSKTSFNHNKGLVTAVSCCTDSTSVEDHAHETCIQVKWWDDDSNAAVSTKGWVYCPRGMYLKGLFLEYLPHKDSENVIDKIECCQTQSGVLSYPECYNDETVEYIDSTSHGCRKKGYYITGVLRKNCNNERMECNETLICCR